MNPYSPTPDKENGNDLPILPPENKILEGILENIRRYNNGGQYDLFFRTKDDNDAIPDSFSIHASDISMEATLCQFWSGEHDNGFWSAYVCTLLNIAPSLIQEVIELRTKVEQFENGHPKLKALKTELENLANRIKAL